ncbi:MAG TPA: hypothetical protein VN841_09760 [Bryobacteraceae bacterium]|nr:hypothetical protein [Bryobacteraceae bacterium]
MADKPTTEKKTKVKAAKAADSAAEKSAPPVAAKPAAAPPTISKKKGKLLPKNKHRLPRREKKAQQKSAARL